MPLQRAITWSNNDNNSSLVQAYKSLNAMTFLLHRRTVFAMFGSSVCALGLQVCNKTLASIRWPGQRTSSGANSVLIAFFVNQISDLCFPEIWWASRLCTWDRRRLVIYLCSDCNCLLSSFNLFAQLIIWLIATHHQFSKSVCIRS